MYQNFRWTTVGEQRNFLLRLYEPLQPYIFLELARELGSDIFIDVGANIGAYSIFLSSLDSVRKIYSFEAASETFNELKRNVELNDSHHKIAPFNTAISDHEGKVRFGIVADFSGANSVVDTSIHSTPQFKRESVVDCVPLDSAVPERSRNMCVKIDVEGHEKAVLDGAQKLLTNNVAFIQLENYSRQDLSVSNTLKGYGYVELFSIGPDVYFTNRPQILSAEAIISVFERAIGGLIKSNLETLFTPTDPPIRVKLFWGTVLEFSGTPARIARGLRKKFVATQ